MGIEKFFNSLVKNETILKNNIFVLQNKILADYVYIDFNSILYKLALSIENQINKLFYELIDDSHNLSVEAKEIAKKWNYDTVNYSIEDFKNHFNEKFIDNTFLDLIVDDLTYIMTELIDSDHIKKIYISMDGVPNMAKIIEQKKRRYMGYILNESKKDIYLSNKDSLDLDRKMYEENKIRFSRSKFLGHHEFMQQMSEKLKDANVLEDFKKKCKKLESYIFSGYNNPGEGEKKIMEDIIENAEEGKYVVYSPDADVIILSSIMINKLKNNSEIYVLRFDQQELKYDIIDINMLNKNILNYIELNENLKMNTTDVLNDIMFIFTMFGNDFVHKIDSIDPKKDFEILLNIYREFAKGKTFGILSNNAIIYQNLIEYIKLVAEIEKDLINDTYLMKNYKNYHHLKKQFKDLFWFDTLHRTLINYTLLCNIIFKYVRRWEKKFNSDKIYSYWNNNKKRNEINHSNTNNYIEKNFPLMISELIIHDNTIINSKKMSIKQIFNKSVYIRQFIKVFLTLELNVNLESNEINDGNIYDNFMLIMKREIFKHNGKNIFANIMPNIRLDKYNYTTKDKYHSNKITQNMVSDKMKITNFDNENYAFEFMLDKYK